MNLEIIDNSQSLPDSLSENIDKDPILKITRTLSPKGYMSSYILTRFEEISSISDIEERRDAYKNFLHDVESKISEIGGDENNDDVYI